MAGVNLIGVKLERVRAPSTWPWKAQSISISADRPRAPSALEIRQRLDSAAVSTAASHWRQWRLRFLFLFYFYYFFIFFCCRLHYKTRPPPPPRPLWKFSRFSATCKILQFVAFSLSLSLFSACSKADGGCTSNRCQTGVSTSAFNLTLKSAIDIDICRSTACTFRVGDQATTWLCSCEHRSVTLAPVTVALLFLFYFYYFLFSFVVDCTTKRVPPPPPPGPLWKFSRLSATCKILRWPL